MSENQSHEYPFDDDDDEEPTSPSGVPKGYIPGLARSQRNPQIAHLYKGDFSDPGLPMCRYGWNCDGGESYSIWRNNVGPKGICKICMRRAKAGLDGVESPVPETEPTPPLTKEECDQVLAETGVDVSKENGHG